jgi:hypothetical protein
MAKAPWYWTPERIEKVQEILWDISGPVRGSNQRVIRGREGLGARVYDLYTQRQHDELPTRAMVANVLTILAWSGVLDPGPHGRVPEDHTRTFTPGVVVTQDTIERYKRHLKDHSRSRQQN